MQEAAWSPKEDSFCRYLLYSIYTYTRMYAGYITLQTRPRTKLFYMVRYHIMVGSVARGTEF